MKDIVTRPKNNTLKAFAFSVLFFLFFSSIVYYKSFLFEKLCSVSGESKTYESIIKYEAIGKL